MRRYCHSPGPSGARRSSVPRPMDSSSRRALTRTAHAKPDRSQISVMTERRRRRPICGPFDLLGPLRTHHAEIQANRATTAAVASYVQNPGRSQISVMTERRRRRPIRELSHLRRSPRTHHAEFQANRATTAPAAASHIKAKPGAHHGGGGGDLEGVYFYFYSTLLYSSLLLFYSILLLQVR